MALQSSPSPDESGDDFAHSVMQGSSEFRGPCKPLIDADVFDKPTSCGLDSHSNLFSRGQAGYAQLHSPVNSHHSSIGESCISSSGTEVEVDSSAPDDCHVHKSLHNRLSVPVPSHVPSAIGNDNLNFLCDSSNVGLDVSSALDGCNVHTSTHSQIADPHSQCYDQLNFFHFDSGNSARQNAHTCPSDTTSLSMNSAYNVLDLHSTDSLSFGCPLPASVSHQGALAPGDEVAAERLVTGGCPSTTCPRCGYGIEGAFSTDLYALAVADSPGIGQTFDSQDLCTFAGHDIGCAGKHGPCPQQAACLAEPSPRKKASFGSVSLVNFDDDGATLDPLIKLPDGLPGEAAKNSLDEMVPRTVDQVPIPSCHGAHVTAFVQETGSLIDRGAARLRWFPSLLQQFAAPWPIDPLYNVRELHDISWHDNTRMATWITSSVEVGWLDVLIAYHLFTDGSVSASAQEDDTEYMAFPVVIIAQYARWTPSSDTNSGKDCETYYKHVGYTVSVILQPALDPPLKLSKLFKTSKTSNC